MSLKIRETISFTSDEDEVAQLLIAANVDVNSKNNKGATPLIIAAVKGHHSGLRILANNPNTNLHDQVCTTHIRNSTFCVCVCWKLRNCSFKNCEGWFKLPKPTIVKSQVVRGSLKPCGMRYEK